MGAAAGMPRQWSSQDVQNAVSAIAPAFSVYGQALFDNGIDGLALLTLKDSDIATFGIEIKAIHRDRLLRELDSIRKLHKDIVDLPVNTGNNTIQITTLPPVDAQSSNSKFSSNVEHFVFGKDDDFRDGLTKKVKKLVRSMEVECTSNDNGAWKNEYNYVACGKAVEQVVAAHRVRDLGHEGMSLQDFVNHPKAVEAELTVAEVAALRLYTGPLYDPWNKALRLFNHDPSLLVDWATCISVLYSAIFKLSFLSKKAIVYRGVNEAQRQLPQSFLQATAQDSLELGFMSTTINASVAIEYAMKGSDAVGTIFEIQFDAASRGADVQWVSQFPYEAELLYPPCTYLTCEGVRTVPVESLLSATDRDIIATGWTAGLQGSVRCVTVRAAVSTARTDVQQLSHCSDWPDEDVFADCSSSGKPLEWIKGEIRAFYSSNNNNSWSMEFREVRAQPFKVGDYVKLKFLPTIDGVNPSGVWYRCEHQHNGSGPLFNNPGAVVYHCRTDMGPVSFAYIEAARVDAAWIERVNKIEEQRKVDYTNKLQKAREAELAKYSNTWSAGMHLIYDAHERSAFYINFREPVFPVDNLFHVGDYIMFKDMPVMYGADINDVWFSCSSPDRNTPHFHNPGFWYDNRSGVADALFTVCKGGSLTHEQVAANARKISAKLAVHYLCVPAHFVASIIGVNSD